MKESVPWWVTCILMIFTVYILLLILDEILNIGKNLALISEWLSPLSSIELVIVAAVLGIAFIASEKYLKRVKFSRVVPLKNNFFLKNPIFLVRGILSIITSLIIYSSVLNQEHCITGEVRNANTKYALSNVAIELKMIDVDNQLVVLHDTTDGLGNFSICTHGPKETDITISARKQGYVETEEEGFFDDMHFDIRLARIEI